MKTFDKNALLNKKILITGGSSGIGADAAKMFSNCGASILLLGRSEKKLNNVFLELSKKQKHKCIFSDLSLEDAAYKTLNSIDSEFLPLDGIFHSSGSELIKPIQLTKTKDLNYVLSSSLYPALSLSRAVSKKGIMLDGGSVIFMSSVAAISGTVGLSAYSASKSCLEGLLKSLALEFAKRKIRFNSIISGAIESPMHQRIMNNMPLQSKDDYELKHPLGFGRPSDISNLATSLLSDASKWITGSQIVIDGGYTIS